MAVPEAVYGYSGKEVEVLFSIRIPHTRAFSPDYCNRLPSVGRHNVFFIEVNYLFEIHSPSIIRHEERGVRSRERVSALGYSQLTTHNS
jgi:hypothetical protein